MTDCFGEVMATQQCQDLHAYQLDAAIVSEGQLLSANNAGHLDAIPEEWQERLRNLQQCVCELLIKNQQLRMRLELARAGEGSKQGTRIY
jgi:hypothetical protein